MLLLLLLPLPAAAAAAAAVCGDGSGQDEVETAGSCARSWLLYSRLLLLPALVVRVWFGMLMLLGFRS
jgi:hypothetical protein